MSETNVTLKDTIANPAPLGLLGFGCTTVLLNIHNAGFYGMNSMILAMGIFYGGIGQVIAGIMEFKKNNTFGATAFTSYGLFWLSLVFMIVAPGRGWCDATAENAKAAYLIVWGVFTLFMYIGSLKHNRATQVVFGSLTVLFFLLAAGDITGNEALKTFTGWEGIFCGCSAIYAAVAQVVNGEYGKVVLPLGDKK
jgi:uncharacterized protein